IIFGASIDASLNDDMVITVIATGFEKPASRKPERIERPQMRTFFNDDEAPPQSQLSGQPTPGGQSAPGGQAEAGGSGPRPVQPQHGAGRADETPRRGFTERQQAAQGGQQRQPQQQGQPAADLDDIDIPTFLRNKFRK
ncbi:MAG: hypothetical protein LBU58_10225, partial [Clostridiales bacterium]|nr:hypothetical protein [Clostridiales bacterium]